jgi:hypothetical protein
MHGGVWADERERCLKGGSLRREGPAASASKGVGTGHFSRLTERGSAIGVHNLWESGTVTAGGCTQMAKGTSNF